MPDPAARTFWAKTMRQLSFHGPGGPTFRIPDGKSALRVGATGRSPDQPASACGDRSNPLRTGLARPMLFAQKVLAAGSGNQSKSTFSWSLQDYPESLRPTCFSPIVLERDVSVFLPGNRIPFVTMNTQGFDQGGPSLPGVDDLIETPRRGNRVHTGHFFPELGD